MLCWLLCTAWKWPLAVCALYCSLMASASHLHIQATWLLWLLSRHTTLLGRTMMWSTWKHHTLWSCTITQFWLPLRQFSPLSTQIGMVDKGCQKHMPSCDTACQDVVLLQGWNYGPDGQSIAAMLAGDDVHYGWINGGVEERVSILLLSVQGRIATCGVWRMLCLIHGFLFLCQE